MTRKGETYWSRPLPCPRVIRHHIGGVSRIAHFGGRLGSKNIKSGIREQNCSFAPSKMSNSAHGIDQRAFVE